MKYWKKRFEHHTHPHVISTNLLLEHLESIGFKIEQKCSRNIWFDCIIVENNIPSYSSHNKKLSEIEPDFFTRSLYICCADNIASFKNEQLSCLLVLKNPEEPLEKICKTTSVSCTSIISAPTHLNSIAILHSIVLDFFLSMKELSEQLSLASGPQGSFQKIINIGEEFFGSFMNITDANHMLLAHTKHIPPQDEINKSLIEHGFHTEANLKLQKIKGYLPEQIANQQGVKIYSPHDSFPYSLITAVMKTEDQYIGYIVLAMDEASISLGAVDAFSIFAKFCERFAQQKLNMLPTQNSSTQAFLLKLITEKNLSQSFLHERAQLFNIPTRTTFTLAELIYDTKFKNQLAFIATNIDEQIKVPHITLLHEESILLLIYEKSELELWNTLALLEKKSQKNIKPHIYVSDAFYKLSGAYYAYRQIIAIKKYEDKIQLYLQLNNSDNSNILPFRYAFCFYWEDFYADQEIKHFSMSHLLINQIAENDKTEKTNDLALLLCFLTNDKKATNVGQRFHLHRNGVLYRIKKMENEYGFNLDDCLIREYLQASIRIKLTSSQEFSQLICQAYELLEDR